MKSGRQWDYPTKCNTLLNRFSELFAFDAKTSRTAGCMHNAALSGGLHNNERFVIQEPMSGSCKHSVSPEFSVGNVDADRPMAQSNVNYYCELFCFAQSSNDVLNVNLLRWLYSNNCDV